MKTNGNWSFEEDRLLRERLSEGQQLNSVAVELKKSTKAVYLYCYRHHIAIRKIITTPLLPKILEIKFGKVEYFKPDRAFYEQIKISQKRWSVIVNGYEQVTEEEMKRILNALKYTAEEYFKFFESRQLDLFENL